VQENKSDTQKSMKHAIEKMSDKVLLNRHFSRFSAGIRTMLEHYRISKINLVRSTFGGKFGAEPPRDVRPQIS
jgi:hypothetical protein